MSSPGPIAKTAHHHHFTTCLSPKTSCTSLLVCITSLPSAHHKSAPESTPSLTPFHYLNSPLPIARSPVTPVSSSSGAGRCLPRPPSSCPSSSPLPCIAQHSTAQHSTARHGTAHKKSAHRPRTAFAAKWGPRGTNNAWSPRRIPPKYEQRAHLPQPPVRLLLEWSLTQ